MPSPSSLCLSSSPPFHTTSAKRDEERRAAARRQWQERVDSKANAAQAQRAFEQERVDHTQQIDVIRQTQKVTELNLREMVIVGGEWRGQLETLLEINLTNDDPLLLSFMQTF